MSDQNQKLFKEYGLLPCASKEEHLQNLSDRFDAIALKYPPPAMQKKTLKQEQLEFEEKAKESRK